MTDESYQEGYRDAYLQAISDAIDVVNIASGESPEGELDTIRRIAASLARLSRLVIEGHRP